MNIWIIDHYAQPEKYKALIRQTLFAKNLIKFGHRVRIFCASTVHNTDINLITDKSLYKEELVDGINYTYVRCHDYNSNNYKRIINMYEFAYNVAKVCSVYKKKEGQPDSVLCCSMTLQACKAGIKIARKYNAKSVAQITDLWPETLIAYGRAKKTHPIVILFRNIEKWIYKNSDELVFSMEGISEYLEEMGWASVIPKSKMHYINNGVDLKQFDYNRINYTISDEDLENREIFKIVYTGSIRKANNLGKLLDIAKHINSKKIKFLIWGDGDELETLKSRVLNENISNVVFKGKVEKKYIPYITSSADLNYAHSESVALFRFGISLNKIFDYLAAGKPIVCDFTANYNPVLTANAGVEITDADASKMAQAIEETVNSDYLEIYSINARKAAERYDFIKLTKKLERILCYKQN